MAILKLDQLTANQIAAGEVVDRPASIVKELIENSIDAQASKIEISILAGGTQLIKVKDNGLGIAKSDLKLVFARHATSKINSITDVYNLNSFGFRGEALASIASVSEAICTSKLRCNAKQLNQSESNQASSSHELGWQLSYQPSLKQFSSVQPCNTTYGTSIEIKNLFFNVPARKRFLKRDATEYSHIKEVVNRFVLSNPQIEFSLFNNNKQVFHLPAVHEAVDISRRYSKILGEEFVINSVELNETVHQYEFAGRLGLPTFNRASTDMQYLFINNRIVKDKLLSFHIKQAYKDMLYRGRQPCFLLFLTIPPDEIDVNVHPQKYEVKLRESSFFSLLRQVLNSQIVTPSANNLTAELSAVNLQNKVDYTDIDESEPGNSALGLAHSIQVREPATAFNDNYQNNSFNSSLASSLWHSNLPNNCQGGSFKANSFGFDRKHNNAQINNLSFELQDNFYASQTQDEIPSLSLPFGRALGQIANTFLVAETNKGMILIDIHAAHERINYEKLKNQYTNRDLQSQDLIIPESIDLQPQEFEQLDKITPELERLGYNLNLSQSSLLIKAVPSIFAKHNHSNLIKETLQQLVENQSDTVKPILDNFEDELFAILSRVACHKSIRANHKMSLAEMNFFLRQMEQTPSIDQCNHGRSTWQLIDMKQLDAMFDRGK